MAATVNDLLAAAGLRHGGSTRWGLRLTASIPGVYLVTLDQSSNTASAGLAQAPIDEARVADLLRVRPELRVDGDRPTVKVLAERLAGSWLPEETVLYIGMAGTSLANRVSQYYSTRLGARRPHSGGWFLKTLSNLESLTVHYAAAANPAAAERDLMLAFAGGVNEAQRGRLHDSSCAYPFANLIGPTGLRKAHGITGAREPQIRLRSS
jgi:hypothetical protein